MCKLGNLLSQLEKEWGKNVGFYGIPPCKFFPNGGYEVNLIPQDKEEVYIFGLLGDKKPATETLEEAIEKALNLAKIIKKQIKNNS